MSPRPSRLAQVEDAAAVPHAAIAVDHGWRQFGILDEPAVVADVREGLDREAVLREQIEQMAQAEHAVRIELDALRAFTRAVDDVVRTSGAWPPVGERESR